ncbi:MAG: tRNA (N(6)-L-threonylcarbamoyladenosine(37)-C(2))-methylthiotransferase MtaB [Thermodesulfovibrionia bacterium]|nr:tRNA (N(6)-L-threonylcarbamoyladenosine(37)-C(2))-methylthiotransferase MtaB [Thermodesulfovibrionia bacterium]
MRIAITTLGCKVNQADSASIQGALKEKGYEIVPTLRDNPDVCIVNTCAVTAKSDYQSRQMIRKAAKSGAKVIATGCYAQLRSDELTKIKGVNLILGNSQKDRLPEYLDKLSQNNDKPLQVVETPAAPLTLKPYFSDRTRAFLKIQDGCSLSCSYCTVPLARGKNRSLSSQDVLKAVNKFNTDGYKEIVLTGIHIGSYGLDLQPKSDLLEIMHNISNLYPDMRLRLSSIEPQEFKKDLLTLIKEGMICPHLHIPLQSGSDNILKIMNRGYSVSFYKKLIADIISICPDISIGTDIIVGFPGEEDKEFEHTVRLIEELPFSYIHVFPYSKRPDTKAARLPQQVKNSAKKERSKIILDIAINKKNIYISKQLGKKLDVIVEKKDITTGFYRTISDNYLRPLVHANNLILGQRLKIEAISLVNGELFGVPLQSR